MTLNPPPFRRSPPRNAVKGRFNDLWRAVAIVVFVALGLWLVVPVLLKLLFAFVSFLLFQALAVVVVGAAIYFYVRSRMGGG